MRAVSLRRTFALGASLLALGALPSTAAATSGQAEIDAAVDKGAAYLAGKQEAATGKIPGFGGDWAAVSLAAAGVASADVHGPAAGDPSLQDYLLGLYTEETWIKDPPSGNPGEPARATIVSHAAGLDPARLSADSNQPAQLAGLWSPATGSFGFGGGSESAFAILAMKIAGLPNWALAPTVSFLRRNQHDDGGWTFETAPTPEVRAEPSEEDTTGAAVASLCAAGVPTYDPTVGSALAFLRGRLIDATGGIEYQWGPNASTNAAVISGLQACGIDPQSPGWTTSAGKTPVDFLLALQVTAGPTAGGFGSEDNSSANDYATQEALRALAGSGFSAEPQSVRSAPTVAAGTPVPHVLAVELAPGNVRICKVVAPVGAPLTEVLAAAEAGSSPAGCVSSVAVVDGAVRGINGVEPEGEDEAWLARLDRGAQALAAQQPVGFGETIVLRLGKNPSTAVGPQGPPGPAGTPASPGPAGKAGQRGQQGKAGKRGKKGKPGRSAKRGKACRKRARAAKRRGNCRAKRAARQPRSLAAAKPSR